MFRALVSESLSCCRLRFFCNDDNALFAVNVKYIQKMLDNTSEHDYHVPSPLCKDLHQCTIIAVVVVELSLLSFSYSYESILPLNGKLLIVKVSKSRR